MSESTPNRGTKKRRRSSVFLDIEDKLLIASPGGRRIPQNEPSAEFELPEHAGATGLAFVGRIDESRKLATLLLQNSFESLNTGEKKKPILILLSHMNGMGKSTLARRFREVLSNEDNPNGWSKFSTKSVGKQQVLQNLK